MLAEPVKNTSYVLQPRGKPLYEDESQANSFGMKMLTKMGWNKDKGLGAKEDGAKDFIRVRYKNSSTGMGFQEKDTQWTEHEDHFSQLLNNLQAGEDEDTNRNCESLEEKSRKSRARVHYKKFTKGKDLSQYSEKDLANIFGRKSLKKEMSKDEDAQEDSRSNFGVETMTSELSINDYFKKKMSQMEATAVEDVSGESSKKKKKRKQQDRPEEDELPKDPSEDSATKVDNVSDEEPKKKRKRKSKPAVEESEKNEETLQVVKSPTENEKEMTKDPESKKSKRKNKKIPQQDPDTSQNPSEESTSDRKVKKKNKQKSESTELVTVVEESPADSQLPSTTKKSKKKEKQLSAEDDTIPPKLRESLKEYSANGDVVYKLPMRKCDILMKLDCAAFKGSNISSVIGYRLTEKIDLEVIEDFQTAKNEDGAKEEDPYDERL